MNRMKSMVVGASLLLALPVAPVAAQAAPAITVGMQVLDTANNGVGQIVAMRDGTVTLKTDRFEIPLPATSFALQDGKLYFAMTRAQVNAEYEKAMKAAEASLAVGAPVKGLAGTQVGTIESIDDQKVMIKLANGRLVQLPRNGIAGGVDGAVIGISAEDLAKEIAQ